MAMLLKKKLNDVISYLIGSQCFKFSNRSHSLDYPVDYTFVFSQMNLYFPKVDEYGVPFHGTQINRYYNYSGVCGKAIAHLQRYIDFNNEIDKKAFLIIGSQILESLKSKKLFNNKWGPLNSCLSQGLLISVLIRCYSLNKDASFLQEAIKISRNFYLDSNNIMISKIENKFPFLEEYPYNDATHVFNGFLSALIGLHDILMFNTDPMAFESFNVYKNTLIQNIHLWCRDNWSLYDLENPEKGANYNTPNYHNLQIAQLMWLNKHYPDSNVSLVIQQWTCGSELLPQRIKALFHKINYRYN